MKSPQRLLLPICFCIIMLIGLMSIFALSDCPLEAVAATEVEVTTEFGRIPIQLKDGRSFSKLIDPIVFGPNQLTSWSDCKDPIYSFM